ncbi:GAF domain-containing protein, partial [Actinoplanes sp. NPDC051411]|uniref:sensor domain-containing phosphodiesterase n=1 Tax=Actinoplanes sp. NPDC051411 TaxID=3155522 RepID=UPI003443EFAB
MVKERGDTAQQIADLLRAAKGSLGLSLAFLSRMDGLTQHLEVVESASPAPLSDGATQPQETSFCQAVMDGRLPSVIPDVEEFPDAMRLPGAQMGVRSFVSVPVLLSDGSVYGSFCAAGFTAEKELTDRDRALMEVLAHAAAMLLEPDVRKRRRNAEIGGRLQPLIDDGGPVVLLQPIVDLATGHRVGSEALSRFPQQWNQPPDVVFAEAEAIGQREHLEILALRQAAAHLPHVSGYVAMNVSARTLATPACLDLLGHLPLDRVVLEPGDAHTRDRYQAPPAPPAPPRGPGHRRGVDAG